VTDIINCSVLNAAKIGDGRRTSSACLLTSNDAKPADADSELTEWYGKCS